VPALLLEETESETSEVKPASETDFIAEYRKTLTDEDRCRLEQADGQLGLQSHKKSKKAKSNKQRVTSANQKLMMELIGKERQRQRKELSHERILNLSEIVKVGRRLMNSQEKKDIRAATVLKSNIVRLVPNVDMDKKLFLCEFMKILAYADSYFKQRLYVAFYNAALTLTFLAIQVSEYSLADKTYSLFGQMLLAAKRYDLALELYRKLRNCAHTHKDIISKMFALHMMAHCFFKMEKYEDAVVAYKYLLALSWASKSQEIELSAYQGLARMHLYLGNIEKVKFYDAKITYGQYEPEYSQGYKVHVANVMNEHPWLKETLNRDQTEHGQLAGLLFLQRQAEEVYQFDTHLKTLFSEKLLDFSLFKADVVAALSEVTGHFKKCHESGKHLEMIDPSI